MGYPIKGKTALVTGANRGIGEAIVDALVSAGAAKVYAAARNLKDLGALTARHGTRVVALQLDVTDPAQVAAAAAAAPDVQLLVNNAGYAGYSGGSFDDKKWLVAGRQEMDVNFFGTFAVSQAFCACAVNSFGSKNTSHQHTNHTAYTVAREYVKCIFKRCLSFPVNNKVTDKSSNSTDEQA